MLEIKHLSAGYGKKEVLKDVSFSLEGGQIVGLLGSNGCGKTTLLKAICGILPHEGECLLSGTNLEKLPDKEKGRLLGYIPQKSGISVDITLEEVVLMGFYARLRLLEQPNTQMRQKALEALKLVGLEGMEQRGFQTLSEGQKQLCILARTLVADSKVLLLDEPESALDFEHRYRMMELLQNWSAETKGLALITLHDPQLALNCCDKIVLVKEGKVSGILQPSGDDLQSMTEKLSEIYGKISLHAVKKASGETQLVMIKE